SLAPHQRIVNSREGLAVPYRRRKAAPMFHGSNEIVEKPVHHLSRRRGSIVSGGVHAADCARQTGDRAAAAEPIPLEQDHFRTLPSFSTVRPPLLIVVARPAVVNVPVNTRSFAFCAMSMNPPAPGLLVPKRLTFTFPKASNWANASAAKGQFPPSMKSNCWSP